jgi:hypothetical protein
MADNSLLPDSDDKLRVEMPHVGNFPTAQVEQQSLDLFISIEWRLTSIERRLNSIERLVKDLPTSFTSNQQPIRDLSIRLKAKSPEPTVKALSIRLKAKSPGHTAEEQSNRTIVQIRRRQR